MTNPVISRTELIHEAPATHKVLDKEFVGTFGDGDITPSVLNLKKFKAGCTAPCNITYFDDGFDGLDISILGDGFSTVVHNASKIKTNTGANHLLTAGKVYHFTRYDSIWVEDA